MPLSDREAARDVATRVARDEIRPVKARLNEVEQQLVKIRHELRRRGITLVAEENHDI